MAGTTTYYGITYPTSTDYVKDGATAIQTVATGFDSAVAIPTYNAQTGATYTFALTDVGKTVTASNASAQTYTIPPTSSVAWPTNTTLDVINLGAGVVTFAAGAGVTVTNTAQTLAQYQSASLVRTGLNAWTIMPKSGGSSGLTLVKTQTIGSAVTSVIITSAFSATYDNYFITVGDTACSLANDNVGFQLRTGSTTAITNYRYSGLYTAYNTTIGYTVSTSNSQMLGLGRGLAATEKTSFGFFLYSPFLANKTVINGLGYVGSDLAGYTVGYHSTAASYDQFVLNAVDGGNLTGGTVSVYGYLK